MKLSSIHHAAIMVSDYEKSRDFYVNQLGFQGIWEHYREEKNDWKLDLQVGEGAAAVDLEILWRAEPSEARKPAGGLRAETPGIPGGECGGDSQGAGSPWHFLRTNLAR